MSEKIKPEFVPIYPVHDSLDDAWEFINSQLPITETNDLKSLIISYHNTLINAIQEQEK